jgi:hypothetical protein
MLKEMSLSIDSRGVTCMIKHRNKGASIFGALDHEGPQNSNLNIIQK